MSVKNLERRFDMCSFILEARVTHYDSLMEEFNISKSTAIRDVRFISDYLLALDTQPGCAGYIKVLDSAAQSSLIKLNQNDATVLIRLYKAICEYDYETIVDNQERMIVVLHKLMSLPFSPEQLKDVV